MRLYSVYEIEKLSKGRLSKYRLIQAIGEGFLSAMPMETTRRGRGAPKFLVSEVALKAYLHKLKKEARRGDTLSNDVINDILSIISSESATVVSDVSDVTVDTLISRLHALEQKNAAMEPLVHQGLHWMNHEKVRATHRQALLAQLSETEWYEFEKRKSILEQLNTLS